MKNKIIIAIVTASLSANADEMLAKFKSKPDEATISKLSACYPGHETEIRQWFASGETGFTFNSKNPMAQQAIDATKESGGIIKNFCHPAKKY